MLTAEDVKKLAKLARIALTDEEVLLLQNNLETILGYVDELKNVNTDGLEEVSQVTGLVNVQREDKVVEAGEQTKQDIFKNAPEMKDGYYKVKAIL